MGHLACILTLSYLCWSHNIIYRYYYVILLLSNTLILSWYQLLCQATINCQTNFDGTEFINRVQYKWRVFEMGDCDSMQLLYNTIDWQTVLIWLCTQMALQLLKFLLSPSTLPFRTTLTLQTIRLYKLLFFVKFSEPINLTLTTMLLYALFESV